MTIADFFGWKFIVAYVFLFAALYVHFRGKSRRPLLRHIGDHNTVMAPYNVLMYWFSKVPSKPILNVADFPELIGLRDHWQTIRDEAARLLNEGRIARATGHNDLGFNSFFKYGWKRFYLKWYDDALPSAREQCPKTVELLSKIPKIHGAMFALLPPGGKLKPHRDPYAGSLRFHLGLITPNDDACRIYIDGNQYSWRDGEAIVFDETYLHSAKNDTEITRVILFCDYERPLYTPVMRGLNRLVANTVIRAASTQNVPTEKIGILNRIFALGGRGGDLIGRLKRKNRRVFNYVKYVLVAVGIFVVFVLWR